MGSSAGEKAKPSYAKRVLMRLASHPLVLLPVLVGGSLLLGAWALAIKSGVVIFAGLAALAGGAGVFATKLLAGSKAQQDVLREMQAEGVAEREHELDALEAALEADGDPRTERALHTLRVLASAFAERKVGQAGLDAQTTHDLMTGVDQLFRTCVQYLEKTLALWQDASEMELPEARKAILDRREHLIDDVQAATRHIAEILAQAQEMDARGVDGTSLDRIQSELDASLDIAKKVQERISSWGNTRYDTSVME